LSDFHILDPTADPNWNNLVLSHPNSSFFHSAQWASVLVECYGYKPLYFSRRQDDRLTTLLPVMEVKSWCTGKRGVSLPFTDVCSPFFTDESDSQALFSHAVNFGKREKWKCLELRSGRTFTLDAPASWRYYLHSLDLSPGEDKLFAALKSTVRTAVRKASKSGVEVQMCKSLDAVRQFYNLNCETRRRHGLPPQPFKFFGAISKNVLTQEKGLVVLGTHEGRTIAGSVFFHFGPNALYKYGASDARYQKLRANDLVMWEAIKWYAGQGYRTLSLGRTALSNTGLRRFKNGWGTREETIEYFKYDLAKDAFVTDTDRLSGWHNRIFRALPIPVSRLIGALLYRHMA